MPFPSVKLEELYVNAEEYFHGHDIEEKKGVGLALMREFEKKNGGKGRFLDVGCGVGELLWAGKESGWESEGVDPSIEFIELGREKTRC